MSNFFTDLVISFIEFNKNHLPLMIGFWYIVLGGSSDIIKVKIRRYQDENSKVKG
jgi:hypothetical protein